jgi:urea ABC transporter ATP-binding protein UrtE
MLDIQKLHAGYGSIPVLHDIDLHITQGEAVGILGHNGMGKTTLLRSIIGALLPTQGSIHFNGADVSRLAPNQRAKVGMAYVPQGREIFPNLSVTDNLRMGWVKRGRASAQDLDTLLDNFPRLKPLLDRMGGSLSGGEQQLLALARALAGDPQLLLLDEPTEGIQPSIIEEIAETLTRLRQQRSLTIVLVEQNLDFIASVSERVLVIKRGQITGEIPREHLNDLDIVSEYTGVSSTH